MKRYIKSNTTLKSGSYVADRDGNIYDIMMHVPSTTYLGRGYTHLAPTDVDFLLNQGMISRDEALAVILYCYIEFLEDEEGISDKDEVIPLHKLSVFVDYAELKYTKNAKKLFFSNQYRSLDDLYDALEELPDFNSVNNKWYPYLQDRFVKISRFGNVVEFRISSNDGYDWNKTIIDKIILPNEKGKNSTTKYNIMRESDKGYQEYFYNATLNDILEQDKAVLSSEYLERKIIRGRLYYTRK